METKLIRLVSFVAWFSGAAYAGPGLPGEIPSFEAMAREIRSPITLKLQDLRSTFPMRETSPGVLTFSTEQGELVGTLTLVQTVNVNKTSRMEEVSYQLDDGKTALRERISTTGTDLKPTSATDRIFFADQNPHALKEGETRKIVSFFLGAIEIHRLVSSRGVHPSTGETTLVQEIYFADVKLLSIHDTTSVDGTRRIVDYIFHERGVDLQIPGARSRSCCYPVGTYRVIATRPPGYLIDTIRYFALGKEIFSLDDFVEIFSGNIYEPLFGKNGARGFMKDFVQRIFPKTERRINAATTSPFLIDLLNLRIQIEQAQTNPSLLSQISQKLTLIINAVRDGTLQINDTRVRTP